MRRNKEGKEKPEDYIQSPRTPLNMRTIVDNTFLKIPLK